MVNYRLVNRKFSHYPLSSCVSVYRKIRRKLPKICLKLSLVPDRRPGNYRNSPRINRTRGTDSRPDY
ncbi:MAG UNVERIFIED_CONTAM: hypothetical protein LVR29_31595 [Microcystis novacekii LVE1205-3]